MTLEDTLYTQLSDYVNDWYDSLNDAHKLAKSNRFYDNNVARWIEYLYCYLSCIDEFSDDYE